MDGPLESGKMTGFQAQGSAWDPCRSDIIDLLQSASFEHVEPIYYGSNHTFLVTLTAEQGGSSLAVYKPARGEYPLYDFANGSLYRREVASWLLSDMLRWNLVPPTVVAKGDYGAGSLQVFIEAHAGGEIEIAELRRLSLLDVLLNNADRKAEHCLVGDNGKLWGIDHGLTFHAQPKLRTVIWHFAGTRILADDMSDLKRVRLLLNRPEGPASQLKSLLAPREWAALSARLERLISDGCFPNPRYKPVPYRW
ncbi:MAG TPA: hypothetical protein VF221_05895 [Chloroflexota bacterium]